MAVRVRRTRRQTPGKYRLKKPVWVDPYPSIPGTEPEKRVFALLMQMGVYFIYQGQVPEFEKGSPWFTFAPPNYKPDFVLPEYRLIIDPFSPFHHSLQDAVERDVEKVVAYSAAGYAYYHPWALGGNEWSWDQYHNASKSLTLARGTRKRLVGVRKKKVGNAYKLEGIYKTESFVDRVKLYQGVNADRNKYRGIDRAIGGKRMSTAEMLMSIPELMRGPKYKLTDPRDIKAKKSPGYRIGQYVGAGANSVAAANRARSRPTSLTLSIGQRRLARRRRR